MKTTTVTLVAERDTKNYRVFTQVPTAPDEKPLMGSNVYLPLVTHGDVAAIKVSIEVLAQTETAPATQETPAPAAAASPAPKKSKAAKLAALAA